MKLVRRLIYFSAAFVLVSGAILAFFHQMGLFQVNGIPVEVVGAGDATIMRKSPGAGDEMKTRLANQLRKFDKLKIWEIDLGAVKAAIVRDEWVKEVHISRAFPNEIQVKVKPQSPALVLIDGTAMVPVTDEGRLLGALSAEALPDVPLLRGEVFVKDEKMRARAVKFVSSLPEKGPVSRRNVSEIAWSADEGFMLTLINPRIEVKLGEERIELKVLRVAQVLNYLSANHLRGRVIDASFSKKVLVRLRKGP